MNQGEGIPVLPDIKPPVITTAAMFVSFIFLDLARNEYSSLPPHIIFGVISTLLISIICDKGYTLVAWGLLAIPFIIIMVGYATYKAPAANIVPATQYVDAGKFAKFSGSKRKCSKKTMV
jgi:hypothetical protein